MSQASAPEQTQRSDVPNPDSVRQRSTLQLLKFLATLACLVTGVTPGFAHELRPAIATVVIDEEGSFELELSLNLEAVLAGIGPDHGDTSESPNARQYERLRSLPPSEVQSEFQRFSQEFLAGVTIAFDGTPAALELVEVQVPEVGDRSLARISDLVLRGAVPRGARSLTWAYAASLGDSVIRVKKSGAQGSFFSEYVRSGAQSGLIPLLQIRPQTVWSVFRNYIVIGYEHIVPKGLDHVLFVVGLFLLSPRFKALLWQVTSFTIAHSITLALAMLGLVHIPSSIVEPLIAASIVYVAVENILTDRLQRWRPVVVFFFGLLHGLGFAGVLRDFGLSSGHFLTGLLAFNVGVELGQLTVIAGCFAAVGFWFQTKTWYRSGISIPASVIIGCIGAYWFAERLA